MEQGVYERELDHNKAWLLAHRKKGSYAPKVQVVAEKLVSVWVKLGYLFLIDAF